MGGEIMLERQRARASPRRRLLSRYKGRPASIDDATYIFVRDCLT